MAGAAAESTGVTRRGRGEIGEIKREIKREVRREADWKITREIKRKIKRRRTTDT